MARPKRSVTQAIARLREVWKTDEALAGMPEVRAHVLAVAAHAEAEMGDMGILRQLAIVEVLQLYRKAIERDLEALTQARVVAETVRALRSLGLLAPRGMNNRRAVPMFMSAGRRRRVPTTRGNGQEQEAGDSPAEAADAAEEG